MTRWGKSTVGPDYLDLSAAFIAALLFWAGIPWVLKMPLGHLIDLVWRWKSWLVYLGAGHESEIGTGPQEGSKEEEVGQQLRCSAGRGNSSSISKHNLRGGGLLTARIGRSISTNRRQRGCLVGLAL